jgi:hypothetical protein
MNESAVTHCAKAVSLFRGLYARVAHKLGVDVSYVSRIARGERKSKVAEKAIAREFKKVVSVMRNGPASSGKKNHVVVTLQCPRCKTMQNIHIAVRTVFGGLGGDRVACINCDHRFKVTIPNKIIRGPFPA